MIELAPDDPRLGAAGVAAFVRKDDRWEPLRLPAATLPLLHPELALKVRMAAGIRFRFTTDAVALTLPVDVEDAVVTSPFDILVDGRLAHRARADEGVIRVRLPAGPKRVELWLPQFGVLRLGRLRLDGSQVEAAGDRGLRFAVYGSSITQCREAEGPSETWPALVAREHGWDLRCLGVGGQCHLDPAVARYLRETPAELIALCLGINVHNQGTFTERSLGAAVMGFVQTVRDGHPRTPIVVMTPIASPEREHLPSAAGLTLAEVRSIVRLAAEQLIEAGDERLTILDGLATLGPADAALLHDGLHPNAEGYRLMAERLAGPLAAASRQRDA